MKFNVAKQPLIPAFLSLLVLTIIALSNTTEGALWLNVRGGVAPEALPIPLLGGWLQQVQLLHPTLSHLLAGFLMLYTGASLGRLTLRYNLYGTGTCLSIPLYGVVMIGTMSGGCYLTAVVVSMLLTLAVKNLCMSYRNGFGFDRIFRSALFFALLVLVLPVAAPLLLLLPLAVRRFRRTVRESAVALGGLLLPFALLCYVNWGLGGEFTAPLRALGAAFTEGGWGEAWLTATPTDRLFFGVLLTLNLVAYSLFRTNSYNVSIKARHILLLVSQQLLLTLLAGAMPLVPTLMPALLAIPTTLLLPVLFIRIHHSIAQLLYPLLIIAAVASLFLR